MGRGLANNIVPKLHFLSSLSTYRACGTIKKSLSAKLPREHAETAAARRRKWADEVIMRSEERCHSTTVDSFIEHQRIMPCVTGGHRPTS